MKHPDDIKFSSDKYFNNKKECDDMAEMFGSEPCPVDMNGAYVPPTKGNIKSKDLSEVAENMRERFSLESQVDLNEDETDEKSEY